MTEMPIDDSDLQALLDFAQEVERRMTPEQRAIAESLARRLGYWRCLTCGEHGVSFTASDDAWSHAQAEGHTTESAAEPFTTPRHAALDPASPDYDDPMVELHDRMLDAYHAVHCPLLPDHAWTRCANQELYRVRVDAMIHRMTGPASAHAKG